MTRFELGEISSSEHVSSTQGENINAKRIALYGYDYANNIWRRISVNTDGKLIADSILKGTGVNTQVAFWTGTNTLSSSSAFAFTPGTGRLALSTTGSGAGILIGGDTQLYRSSANLLRTPDSLRIDQNLRVIGTAHYDKFGSSTNNQVLVASVDLGVYGFTGSVVNFPKRTITLPGMSAKATNTTIIVRVNGDMGASTATVQDYEKEFRVAIGAGEVLTTNQSRVTKRIGSQIGISEISKSGDDLVFTVQWNANFTRSFGIYITAFGRDAGGILGATVEDQEAGTFNEIPPETPQIRMSGPMQQPSWGTAGVGLTMPAVTYTNTSTAASGTATSAVIHSFLTPTISATNPNVTVSDAATLYISNAPLAGGNVTITRSHAIWVAAGDVRFDGHLLLASTRTINFDNGNVVLTHSSGTLTVSTGALEITTPTNNAGSVITRDGAQQLFSKRIFPRVQTLTTGSSLSPSKVTADITNYTALAQTLTINNPGFLVLGEEFQLLIKDDGTARDLTWTGNHYKAVDGQTLPTSTVVGKTMHFRFLRTSASMVLVSYTVES